MSAAKHTPGPWWATESGIRDRGGYICHTRPAQRYLGQDERFEKETKERAANKQLIAAAPELLEALQAMLEAFGKDGLGGEYDPGEVPAIDLALAATAKALGEQA